MPRGRRAKLSKFVTSQFLLDTQSGLCVETCSRIAATGAPALLIVSQREHRSAVMVCKRPAAEIQEPDQLKPAAPHVDISRKKPKSATPDSPLRPGDSLSFSHGTCCADEFFVVTAPDTVQNLFLHSCFEARLGANTKKKLCQKSMRKPRGLLDSECSTLSCRRRLLAGGEEMQGGPAGGGMCRLSLL